MSDSSLLCVNIGFETCVSKHSVAVRVVCIVHQQIVRVPNLVVVFEAFDTLRIKAVSLVLLDLFLARTLSPRLENIISGALVGRV